ncbi:hypothetical protein FACS189413_16510 [Bacteroidia bacterium]|nr:hypothetical protein FACS189413_16510 [Bacteroidia bacterium]
MLIALVYALPLLIENKRHAFEETIVLLCYTFALQGFIHLCGYIFEPVGELIMTIHGPEFQAFINDPERNIDIFRGYALCGSIFFELPATYGLVCILFFRLQLEENQTYLTGYKSFVVILLIMTGIMLSGRTGFIGFFCGLAYYLFYLFEKKKALMNTIWKLGVVFTLLLLLFYLIFPAKIQQSLIEDVFPFAFEFYYNYEETGSLSTSSTDDLQKNHWFYIEDDILLKGEGLPSAYDSSRHGGSDAGYVNSIVFGGILWLICLIIYQALYFISPLTVAGGVRSKSTKQDAFCFLVLFLYLFILHYKAPTIGTIHSVETVLFFMGASYLIKYYTTENLES